MVYSELKTVPAAHFEVILLSLPEGFERSTGNMSHSR
jgi:hypothetical protein